MKVYALHHRQQLPISLEQAWDFFSSPGNLNEITPPELQFEIRSGAEEKMYAGQVITYRIKPMFNIPMTWVTEITHCEHQQYFVDEQRFGPYKFWHHQHRFTPQDGGVLMEDLLHYALPAGILGETIMGKNIWNKVQHIFAYRTKKLEQLFGAAQGATAADRNIAGLPV